MTTTQDSLDAYAKFAFAMEPGEVATLEEQLLEPRHPESPLSLTDYLDEIGDELAQRALFRQILSRFLYSGDPPTDLPFLLTLGHEGEQPIHGHSARVSPFEEIDDARANDERVHELISHVRGSLSHPFARKLAQRLKDLREIAKEEAPEQSELSAESLQMFIKYLQLTPMITCPEATLTPSGNVRVQWRERPERHFAIEFFPDGQAAFVIFRPDCTVPGLTYRMSAVASVERVMAEAEPHGVRDWIGR